MRRNLIGLLAAAAVAAGAGATPAQAISDRPECEVDASWTGGTRADATIAAVIPLTAGTDPAKYPVSATVTCSITVDGVTEAAITEQATGVAVVAGKRQFRYSATTGFKICTTIDYTSNTNATDHWCVQRNWTDYVDYVFDTINDASYRADPYLCPALAALSPQTSPDDDVYIDGQGDVYLTGALWWDCPPYEPPA